MTTAPIADLDAEIAALEARKIKLAHLAQLRAEVALMALQNHRAQDEILQRAIHLVAARRQLTPDALLSPCRTRRVAESRFILISLLRRHTRLSNSEIGRIFRRDHTTITYALQRADDLLRTDASFRADLDALAAELGVLFKLPTP